jgi:iron-sulfur cluster insertion protein
MNNSFKITPSALAKIKQRLSADGRPALQFQIGIEGGGCSGLQYTFSLVPLLAESMILWQEDDVTVVSDPLSKRYLQGATLDYRQDLRSAKFVVHNPNAEMSCGCGASFTLKEQETVCAYSTNVCDSLPGSNEAP